MSDLGRVRDVADYQFGAGAGEVLIPGNAEFTHSRGGRIRQVLVDDVHVCTLRDNGLLTLGDLGARYLFEGLDGLSMCVVFDEDAVPFLREGRNGFAGFVLDVDPGVRPRDEVVVVGSGEEFIGAGRAEMSAGEMMGFGSGLAVMTR